MKKIRSSSMLDMAVDGERRLKPETTKKYNEIYVTFGLLVARLVSFGRNYISKSGIRVVCEILKHGSIDSRKQNYFKVKNSCVLKRFRLYKLFTICNL